MTKREESKLEMVNDVNNLIEINSDKFSSVTAIKKVNEELKQISNECLSCEKKMKKDTRGVTKSKNDAENEIITDAVVIAGAVYSYGESIKNPALMLEADITENNFKLIRDTDIPIKANEILDLAKKYAPLLSNFGVTQDTLNKLTADLEDYKTKIGETGTGKLDKVSARSILSTLLNTIDIKLSSLDKMMKRFEKSDYELFVKYENARLLRDKPTFSKEKEEEPPAGKQDNSASAKSNS